MPWPDDLDLENLPPFIDLCGSDGNHPVKILEAQEPGEDGDEQLPRFEMEAYTGGLLFANYGLPVVIDYEGLEIPATGIRPVRKDHNEALNLGHSDAISVVDNILKVKGLFSGVSRVVADVIGAAKNGFPWQASVTARPERMIFVDSDQSVEVNGKSFDGPIYVFRKSTLGEISVVDLGADQNTATRLAASDNQHPTPEIITMEFEAWLKAKCGELKLDPESLTEDTKTVLKAQFDAEQQSPPAKKPDPEPVKASGNTPPTPTPEKTFSADDLKAAAGEAVATALANQAKVLAACGGDQDLVVKAHAEGWDEGRCKAEIKLKELQGSMPKAPMLNLADQNISESKVLEAAFCQATGVKIEEKDYGDQILQAAHDQFHGRISLQQMLMLKARANGYSGPDYRIHDGNLRDVLKAAFSTRDIEGIIGAIANKSVLQGYSHVEDTWSRLCKTRPVQNLQKHTAYRLTGDMMYKEVGKDGRLKHADLSEQKYENEAETFGIILQIDRKDIINDNAGALAEAPMQLGRGGALKINDVFWKKWFDDAAFFTAGNNNLETGAGSALSIDALSLLSTKQDDQVDSEGRPLGVPAKKLLVGTANKWTAKQILTSSDLRAFDDASGREFFGTRNPHADQYDLEVSAYIGNAEYGDTTTAWWLLCDPMALAAIEMVFLNGVQNPTVESVAVDSDQLGIAMRGLHDFGAEFVDPRAAQKATGA